MKLKKIIMNKQLIKLGIRMSLRGITARYKKCCSAYYV